MPKRLINAINRQNVIEIILCLLLIALNIMIIGVVISLLLVHSCETVIKWEGRNF